MTGTQLTVSREAYDVLILMQAGLGSNKIAAALGIAHSAVLSRQNTLEAKGVISKGTMNGERRSILLTPDQYKVEPEHRATIAARAKNDRKQAALRETRLANLDKARAAKAARTMPAVEVPVEILEPAVA